MAKPLPPPFDKQKVVAENRRARFDYFVEERFEAGIQLRGTEVKSIRAGRAQINEAFGRVKNGELWLVNAHIDEYSFGSYMNHETRRDRKLLLHRSELRKIIQAIEVEGRSLFPLRLYFKEALVKAEIAPYKYPRALDFVAELPKTQTGKLQRFRLREET